MADSADVRSFERLSVFQTKAEHFRTQLLKEIENLLLELRRLKNWIEQDAATYWTEQLTTAQRNFVECQDALVRCMSYVREDERQPCTEQKKRLKKAKERKALCEEKLKTVRAAAAAWERESQKNLTKVHRCRDLAESDLTVAIHHLRGQIEQLEAYSNLKSSAVAGRSVTTQSSSIDNTVDQDSSHSSAVDSKAEGRVNDAKD